MQLRLRTTRLKGPFTYSEIFLTVTSQGITHEPILQFRKLRPSEMK